MVYQYGLPNSNTAVSMSNMVSHFHSYRASSIFFCYDISLILYFLINKLQILDIIIAYLPISSYICDLNTLFNYFSNLT